MTRVIVIFLLISGYGITYVQGQATSSFNFSLTSKPVTGWTNIHGDPAMAACSATDATTGITVSSIATVNWAGYGGSSAFDGGGQTGGTFFPAAVMANHWFQANAIYAAYNALLPQLEISGLNVDSVYTLKMTGSFANNIPSTFDLNPIRYTVAATTVDGFIDINGNFNTSDGAVFHNIAPDASGKIKVYVNTYGASNTASICGIQVICQRTTAPMPTVVITNPGNNGVVPEDLDVNFNVTATETGGSIANVEFFIDNVQVGVDSTAPYSYTWMNPDAGSYTLKARAIDGLGNTTVVTSNVSVESLSSFWSMTGNISANADSNFLGTVDTNRLAIRTNNVERVSILGDGTVGIGTKNTQGYKLAVNGNAIFTKVRIKAYSAWPDYVFKKDYQLPGLDSLDKYIRLHQHLPGIAPAAEVKTAGMDVADGQAALLKKVEELTLYLIREHKEVEKLTREVERLKAQHKKRKTASNGKSH
jgi:hypothetical protein